MRCKQSSTQHQLIGHLQREQRSSTETLRNSAISDNWRANCKLVIKAQDILGVFCYLNVGSVISLAEMLFLYAAKLEIVMQSHLPDKFAKYTPVSLL
jgi:hypothetical protein